VFEDRLRQLADGAPTHEVMADLDRAPELAVRAAYTAGQEERAGVHRTAAVVTFADATAANVKRLRNEAGWTQEQLARDMSAVGFDWKRITVAEVEAASRRVSLEEMVGLASLFGETVMAFLDVRANYLRFGAARSLSGDELIEMFCGEGWQGGTVGPTWSRAAAVAGAEPGDRDWRPAPALWKRRSKGYGEGRPEGPARRRAKAPKPGAKQ